MITAQTADVVAMVTERKKSRRKSPSDESSATRSRLLPAGMVRNGAEQEQKRAGPDPAAVALREPRSEDGADDEGREDDADDPGGHVHRTPCRAPRAPRPGRGTRARAPSRNRRARRSARRPPRSARTARGRRCSGRRSRSGTRKKTSRSASAGVVSAYVASRSWTRRLQRLLLDRARRRRHGRSCRHSSASSRPAGSRARSSPHARPTLPSPPRPPPRTPAGSGAAARTTPAAARTPTDRRG